MPFVIKDGLGALVDSVEANLAARGVTAIVEIGWKEPGKQAQGPGGANRVVFIPSGEDGSAGEIVAPKLAGMNEIKDGANVVAYVRELRDWAREVVVSVWAADTTAPENERKQYEATVALLEEVMRSVQRFAPQRAAWGRARWIRPALERQFGRELRVDMVFTYPLFDLPEELAFPENVAVTPTLNPDEA